MVTTSQRKASWLELLFPPLLAGLNLFGFQFFLTGLGMGGLLLFSK